MRYKLKEVAEYRKEKVSIEEITLNNYISTENMLPNKEGITQSSGLPVTKFVARYKKGDILISNIRPYFKKIWLAQFDGGASNDVLIIRPKKISNEQLYFTLMNDKFFDYMTGTAKGTKMPRGDKHAVMEYELNLPNQNEAGKIVSTLSSIEKKIEINKSLIKNLEKTSTLIFKHWFIDFEFPNEEGQPYQSSGGEMVDSELGRIPEEWKVLSISEYATVGSGKRPKIKVDTPDSTNKYPIIGASKIMGHTNDFLFNEEILVMGRVGTHGIIQNYRTEIWPSDNTLTLRSDYLYFLENVLRQVDFKALNRGSTQPLITQTDIKKIPTPFNEEIVLEFEKNISPFKDEIYNLERENEKLANIRDLLLPKLLSGEIELPVEVDMIES